MDSKIDAGKLTVEITNSSIEPLCSPLEAHPIMRVVLADYVADLPTHVADMMNALSRQDWERLRRLTHQMVGSGGSYGFPEVSKFAAIAERAILSKQSAEVIAREVQSVIEIMRRVSGYDRVKELPIAA